MHSTFSLAEKIIESEGSLEKWIEERTDRFVECKADHVCVCERESVSCPEVGLHDMTVKMVQLQRDGSMCM